MSSFLSRLSVQEPQYVWFSKKNPREEGFEPKQIRNHSTH